MKRFLPILFLPVLAHAQADPDAKLREALRTTAIQLRTAQTDLANAQATTAAAEQKNKDLTKQLAEANDRLIAQTKRTSEEKTATDKTIASLNNKVADRDKRIAEFSDANEKWKAAYQQAAAAAQSKDAESTRLSAEAAVLKRTVADRERKNIALFNTAQEILDRYENHALGKAILAKEPFTGNSRVKIENLVQGYNDRILDNRVSAKQ
mgnify:CR=1 FL=1